MHNKLSAAALALALLTGPTFAQTGAATNSAGNMADTMPSNRNSVMTDSGEVRTSKVIGSSVYNDHDEKVGSVDDLLIGTDGKLNAVLSVGGFLGIGTKYVEVPYSNLTFGDTQKDSDNKVVLKGATKDSLKAQTGFDYYKS